MGSVTAGGKPRNFSAVLPKTVPGEGGMVLTAGGLLWIGFWGKKIHPGEGGEALA